jgi:4-hydroxy-tetrahydrodipicolinate synthase
VVDLAADTTEQICEAAPNVVGIKDATANVLRCQELKRRLGDRLAVLSGDDALTLPMMAVGAAGVISVTSNVRPRAVSEVTRRVLAGEWTSARAAHLSLLELHGLLFAEPNPAPAKAALAAGLLEPVRMSAAVRLPLVPASEGLRRRIAAALASLDGRRDAGSSALGRGTEGPAA